MIKLHFVHVDQLVFITLKLWNLQRAIGRRSVSGWWEESARQRKARGDTGYGNVNDIILKRPDHFKRTENQDPSPTVHQQSFLWIQRRGENWKYCFQMRGRTFETEHAGP